MRSAFIKLQLLKTDKNNKTDILNTQLVIFYLFIVMKMLNLRAILVFMVYVKKPI